MKTMGTRYRRLIQLLPIGLTFLASAAVHANAYYNVGMFWQQSSPTTGGLVYVTNGTDQSISMYTMDSNSGLLTATSPATTGVSVGWGTTLAADPFGRFVYASNYHDGTLSMYTINQTSGVLSINSTPTIATGDLPVGITVDPKGRFVYAALYDSGLVSMYTINQTTGNLTPTSPPTVTAGAQPDWITTDPSGKFVYAANYNGENLSMYTINQTTGVLTATSPATVAADSIPYVPVVDPTGRFAYVANFHGNDISMYTVNQTTGVLTAASPATIAAENIEPWGVTVDPTGKFAYVGNYGDGSVSMYTINQSTGVLSPNSPSTIAVGSPSQVRTIATDAAGKFAYVATDYAVSMYLINPSTGVLSPNSPATIASGNGSAYGGRSLVNVRFPSCALVQQTTASVFNGGTSWALPTINVNAGDTLVLSYGDGPSAGGSNYGVISSIRDDNGGIWNMAVQGSTSPSKDAEIWYAPAHASGATNITVTLSAAGTGAAVNLSEWAGILPFNSVDVTNSATNAATATLSAPSVPTAYAKDLVLAVGATLSSASLTAGPTNGFTALSSAAPNSGSLTAAAYQIVTSPASYSTAWTINASHATATVTAGFRCR